MPQVTLGLFEEIGHGRGFTEVATVTPPAANTSFVYKLDGRYWERPSSLAFSLTTDANAANRTVSVTFANGNGLVIARHVSPSVQTAGLTWNYTLLPNQSTYNTVVGLNVSMPLWHGFMREEGTLTIAVASSQAGDQIKNIAYDRARFITGPGGYLQGDVEDIENARLLAALKAALLAA